MLNNMNLAYTGPVYFGTPIQHNDNGAEFVYDTGSGYLTTTSTLCSSCGSQYYDPSESTSFKVVQTQDMELDYGSANLVGKLASDRTCLSETTCVNDFEFFVITHQNGLTGYDGILGMSPADEAQNGPSYVKALYDQGIIDR